MNALRNPILIIIILISIVIGSATLTRGHDWGDDFASYIMQTQSILNGNARDFVTRNAFTVFESSIQIGPAAYPWGYPLALTPAYALKGLRPLPLKFPSIIFFAGFLLCLFYLTKHRFTRTESLLLVALFAFNPLLLQYLDYIESDIAFLFISTLALVLLTNKTERSPRDHIVLGMTIAAAFFVRTQGILLLFSYSAIQIFDLWTNKKNRTFINKNIRDFIFVLGGFGFLWVIYALVFPSGNQSYFAQYSTFTIETALGFINSYFQIFSVFFGEEIIWKYLYYVLFIFFLIGAWARKKEEPIFIIYFSAWMLLLITWPYWQGPRFIFPLFPIFIYFTFWGMKTIIAKLSEHHQRSRQVVFISFWLIITTVFLYRSVSHAYVNLKESRAINGPFDTFSTEMFTFIKEETSPDSVIIFFKPRAMRLFTNRDSIMILECERLTLGNYVALHKKWDNSQVPPQEIEECGIPLKAVFENRRFIVYQVLK